MTIQEMRGLIHGVVWHECNYNEAATEDLAEGLVWDIDATVEKITEKFLNDGTYYLVRDWEEWRRDEAIHLAALDYFSSYEPVLVKIGVTA
jgi:hypothetical protein